MRLVGIRGFPAAYCCVLVAVMVLSACTTVRPRYPDGRLVTMTRAEFAAYTERVFRYHNRVVNELILSVGLADGGPLDSSDPLVRAETEMAARCQPLNEAVAATIEGRTLGFFHKLQMLNAVPACEVATDSVIALLEPVQ